MQFALKLTWQVQENSIMFILIYLERKSFTLLLSYFSQKSSIGIMYCVRIARVFCILCEVKRLIHLFVIQYVPLDLVICSLVIDVCRLPFGIRYVSRYIPYTV